MESEVEILDIVDDKNKVVRQEKRSEIHKSGALHRAINILLFNSEGQLFLQQRSKGRWVYPLGWDLSASEHVLAGESCKDAAIRSAKEELGIKVENIEKIRGPFLSQRTYKVNNGDLIDNEFVETFRTIYDGDFKLDKNELEDGRFYDLEEVENLMKEGKVVFTPWFIDEWKEYKKLGLK